jgi:flagellar biosynthesis chaperone FliJ
MVIAVCTPEELNGKANPNVMYELGIADALGKPTLMVTTDLESLPFDVRFKHAFHYRDGELRTAGTRASLLHRLTGYINELKKQTSQDHGLVLQNLSDVWVLQADHRIVLTESFWAYARNVFKFAEILRAEGHHLALRMQKLQLFFNTAQRLKPAKLFAWRDFLPEWQLYKDGHTNRLEPYLDSAAREREEAQRSLTKLRAEHSAPAALISRLAGDYEHLKKNIDLYVTAFSQANLTIESLQNTTARGDALFPRIDQLKQKLDSFNSSVNTLIRNLSLEINDRFYTRKRAAAAAG